MAIRKKDQNKNRDLSQKYTDKYRNLQNIYKIFEDLFFCVKIKQKINKNKIKYQV